MIEPLDHTAHKRNTLGSTAEAVAICRRLATKGVELKLCLDTAHLILNEESPVEAVVLAKDFVEEFHFCNCCTDPAHELFGDRHLPFGRPGIVDERQIGAWMTEFMRVKFFGTTARPRVFCEVWKPERMSSIDVIAHCEATLRSGWELAAPAGTRSP
jgi:hypothetical protein